MCIFLLGREGVISTAVIVLVDAQISDFTFVELCKNMYDFSNILDSNNLFFLWQVFCHSFAVVELCKSMYNFCNILASNILLLRQFYVTGVA